MSSSELPSKKKAGRPKTPPTPPMLGIAERSGDGYRIVVVLGGLKVNGKKWEPQAGAELVAAMLEDGMKRLRRSAPSPKVAVQDPELANPATNGDADVLTAESDGAAATSELTMPPGENGSH